VVIEVARISLESDDVSLQTGAMNIMQSIASKNIDMIPLIAKG
jgi:hypothetical protein